MGRTPLISFWSISHSHSFPEIIPPLCLSLSPAVSQVCFSAHLNTQKHQTSTLKTLLEGSNNGNVLLDSHLVLVHLVWSMVVYTALWFCVLRGPIKNMNLKSLSGIQQRCSHCVLESSHWALQSGSCILQSHSARCKK